MADFISVSSSVVARPQILCLQITFTTEGRSSIEKQQVPFARIINSKCFALLLNTAGGG
jgi:hypothetical protein